MMKAAKSNKVESVELTGADQRNYQLFAAPVPNPDGTVDKAIEVVIDITKQKRAEDLYRTLTNSPQIGVFVTQDGKFRLVNPYIQQYSGFSEEELLGMDSLDFVHPDDKEMVRENTIKMLKGERSSPYKLRLINKYGQTMWVAQTVTSIQYQGKRAVLGNNIDITEHKETQELYETLVNSPQVGFFVVQNGKVEFANPYMQEYSGFGQDEVLGMDSIDFVHPDDKEMVRENTIKMLKGERSSPYEFRAVNKDGQIRWVMETVVSILYKGKRAALANQIDITERKETEEKLRESQELLQTLFDSILDGILILDYSGEILSYNSILGKMFDLESTNEAIARNALEFILPESHSAVVKDLTNVKEGRGGYLNSYKVRSASGREFWIEGLGTDILYKGKHVDLVSVRDITERKRAEEQLQYSFIELAETVSRAIGCRDPYTASHQQRVGQLARLVGEKMRLDKDRLQGLYIGGLLHDVGKISIPASILTKPGELSDEEWTLIRAHAKQGYNILKDTNLPWPVADMALHHHERLDGSGYPHAMSGDKLSLENRILGICDVVEAMSSYRPYRPARSKEEVLEEIISRKGTKYDATMVDVMLQIIENGEFEFGWQGEASAATKASEP
jgi:PAS domain S-box-containing protein